VLVLTAQVMLVQDAGGIVRKHNGNCILAAKALADEAVQRGSTDNISCVVIRFAPKSAS
jgi:serine/threonine protein phosphatase PrpC